MSNGNGNSSRDALETQIALRTSIGHGAERIARELGLEVKQVKSILRKRGVKELISTEVSQLRRAVADRITRRALAEADNTFDTYLELRDGVTMDGEEVFTTPATRLASADRIMERVIPRLSVQGEESVGSGLQISDEAAKSIVKALEIGASALLARAWEKRTGKTDVERRASRVELLETGVSVDEDSSLDPLTESTVHNLDSEEVECK